MLFSKLLGGKSTIASNIPRLSQITNNLQCNKPKFPSMIVKSTSRSRAIRGPKKHQLLKKKADSLLRCGVQYQLPALPHPHPTPIIGKKRTAHQADDVPCSFTSKRQRIDVVRAFIAEDPKFRWLKRGRYAILENRDERNRAWKTGNKSFFMDFFSTRFTTSFFPFPSLLQFPDFNSDNHPLSTPSDIMESEETTALTIEPPISTNTPPRSDTAIQEPYCGEKEMEIDEKAFSSEDTFMKDSIPSETKPSRPVYKSSISPVLSPPPSIKKDVFKPSKLRVPAPSTSKSAFPTTFTTTILELTHKAQVSSPKEASEKLPPSSNSTEPPKTGENTSNAQDKAPEPQKEEGKSISEMTEEEIDAINKKSLDEVHTESMINDMGKLLK